MKIKLSTIYTFLKLLLLLFAGYSVYGFYSGFTSSLKRVRDFLNQPVGEPSVQHESVIKSEDLGLVNSTSDFPKRESGRVEGATSPLSVHNHYYPSDRGFYLKAAVFLTVAGVIIFLLLREKARFSRQEKSRIPLARHYASSNPMNYEVEDSERENVPERSLPEKEEIPKLGSEVSVASLSWMGYPSGKIPPYSEQYRINLERNRKHARSSFSSCSNAPNPKLEGVDVGIDPELFGGRGEKSLDVGLFVVRPDASRKAIHDKQLKWHKQLYESARGRQEHCQYQDRSQKVLKKKNDWEGRKKKADSRRKSVECQEEIKRRARIHSSRSRKRPKRKPSDWYERRKKVLERKRAAKEGETTGSMKPSDKGNIKVYNEGILKEAQGIIRGLTTNLVISGVTEVLRKRDSIKEVVSTITKEIPREVLEITKQSHKATTIKTYLAAGVGFVSDIMIVPGLFSRTCEHFCGGMPWKYQPKICNPYSWKARALKDGYCDTHHTIHENTKTVIETIKETKTDFVKVAAQETAETIAKSAVSGVISSLGLNLLYDAVACALQEEYQVTRSSKGFDLSNSTKQRLTYTQKMRRRLRKYDEKAVRGLVSSITAIATSLAVRKHTKDMSARKTAAISIACKLITTTIASNTVGNAYAKLKVLAGTYTSARENIATVGSVANKIGKSTLPQAPK